MSEQTTGVYGNTIYLFYTNYKSEIFLGGVRTFKTPFRLGERNPVYEVRATGSFGPISIRVGRVYEPKTVKYSIGGVRNLHQYFTQFAFTTIFGFTST